MRWVLAVIDDVSNRYNAMTKAEAPILVHGIVAIPPFCVDLPDPPGGGFDCTCGQCRRANLRAEDGEL